MPFPHNFLLFLVSSDYLFNKKEALLELLFMLPVSTSLEAYALRLVVTLYIYSHVHPLHSLFLPVKQVKETDEQIKALKEDSDKLKEEIRAYFGDAEKLTYFGDTVATYKNSVRRTFDKTMLFVAHPELIDEQEKFTKESETRTLLIKLK